jgi:DNA-binding response OmpR family regulator/anti-sigma regulatory factor (Ser/Thr protein kinase)
MTEALLSPLIRLTSGHKAKTTPTILVVDDDRATLMLIEGRLKSYGNQSILMRTGEQALHWLKSHPGEADAILLDRNMPGMNGLELVHRIKHEPEHARLPIIMITGSDSSEHMREGIDAGIFYYLAKPVEDEVLRSVLGAALREAHYQKSLSGEMQHYHTGFGSMLSCRFHIRTLEEAEAIACFAAQLYPVPQRAVHGLAELLVNAVEHGNLGIGYAEKSELLKQNNWREEITRRLEMPEYADKYAELVMEKKDGRILAQITDQGNGFDWKPYLRIDPSRAMDSHGRGIAQANMLAFDQVAYSEKGNRVVCMTPLKPNQAQRLEW